MGVYSTEQSVDIIGICVVKAGLTTGVVVGSAYVLYEKAIKATETNQNQRRPTETNEKSPTKSNGKE